jgi:acyl carrier protein
MSANLNAFQYNDVSSDDSLALDRIRTVLLKHGRLGKDALQLTEDDDLYAAGMTSLSSVNVMLALETEFSVEIPDQLLNRSMFASIRAIDSALRKSANL